MGNKLRGYMQESLGGGASVYQKSPVINKSKIA